MKLMPNVTALFVIIGIDFNQKFAMVVTIWHKNLWALMTLRLLLLKKHYYRINFSFITKIKAVNRMKKCWSKWKKWATIIMKKIIIMMSNITPETTTYQQRYHQRNKRNAWRKLESIIMKIKKATKKWLVSDTIDC